MLMEIEGDHAVEWQFTKARIGGERTIRSISMRRSRAKIDSLLTSSMRDASREIDRAYEELEGGFGVILTGFLPPSFLRIMGGGRGEIDMEKVDSIRARIDKLKKWENNCTRFLRDTVYALNQTEHTATTYAAQQNLYTDKKKTKPDTAQVMMWYREGLRVYCKLSGWE